MDGWADRCHLSSGIFPGKLSWLYQVTALVHFLHSCPLLHEQSTDHCCATGWGCPSYHSCTQAWGLTSSRPLKQCKSSTWNSTTSCTSLTGYPLCRHSPSEVPICWVTCHPYTEKAGLLAHSVIIMTRGPVLNPKRSKLGVNTALHRAMRTCPNWHWKLGQALTNNKGRNLPAPFKSYQGHHWSWWWSCKRKFEEYQWSGLIWLRFVQGGCGQLWYGHSLWGLHHLLRHRWSDHTNHTEEIPEEGMNFL